MMIYWKHIMLRLTVWYDIYLLVNVGVDPEPSALRCEQKIHEFI